MPAISRPTDWAAGLAVAGMLMKRELEYLVGMINELFPQVGLKRGDVESHYSGVRPLPAVDARRGCGFHATSAGAGPPGEEVPGVGGRSARAWAP